MHLETAYKKLLLIKKECSLQKDSIGSSFQGARPSDAGTEDEFSFNGLRSKMHKSVKEIRKVVTYSLLFILCRSCC